MAGNFTLSGLPSGVTTLRFDATPANSLYPTIWPYNVEVPVGTALTLADGMSFPPPVPAAKPTPPQAVFR